MIHNKGSIQSNKGMITSTKPSFLLVILFIVCLSSSVTNTVKAADELNIFIIPHSHCDPGWLNTFQGYFSQQVERILTGVVTELLQDSAKKFVWAEVSFFHLWYERQSRDLRNEMKRIVKNGQLEFIAGGWVQNDEANANFDIVIDQVTEGHEFLHRTFGVVPRIAWQIDPFGHSSLTPSLFARMGFEAVVINRIHYNLKSSFKEKKQMEFLWQGSRSLGEESEIFTHVLHTHYSAPKGFDWEEGSPQVQEGNVAHRAAELVRQMKERATSYRTNNLLVPFGDDFKFQNAHYQFQNMDQLIKHINGRKKEYGVTIQYGTVSDYFDAVFKTSKQKEIVFPRYEGDFFPYADNADAYWTGYYTTRPYLKGHSRSTDAHIKAAEGLYALGRTAQSQAQIGGNSTIGKVDVFWAGLFGDILQARRDAALVQHHDGITGTAKKFVHNDYAQRLDNARSAATKTIKQMMQLLLTDDATPTLFGKYDIEFNGKDDKSTTHAIVVHNPLGWTRRKYLRLIVDTKEVKVTDDAGVNLPAQVLPYWDPTTQNLSDKYELYFMVEVLPLALRTYFVSKASSELSAAYSSTFTEYKKAEGASVIEVGDEPLSISNEHLDVKFSNVTGMIESIYNKDHDIFMPIKHQLVDWITHGRGSGAYIFRPSSEELTYSDETRRSVQVTTGELVSQVCVYIFPDQSRPPQASVCMRVFSSRSIIDQQATIEIGGHVQIVYYVMGHGNKETVARYTTNMNTDKKFYTDNGLEMRGRRADSGQTQADYFPNLSLAYLQDLKSNAQLTLVSRQAMGTSSPSEGSIEQMMHRNLRQDDGRGLGEPNNDDSHVTVQVLLMVQPADLSAKIGRRLALALQHYPRIMMGSASSRGSWTRQYKTTFEPMATQLPPNTHLLSLKARDPHSDDVIIRFAHVYESSQHALMSKPAEIIWNKLFKNWDVASTRERSLAVTMDLEVAKARKPEFAPTTEYLPHQSGLAPVFSKSKLDNQNTDEEGVFISQAALDDKKKAEEQQQQQEQQEQGQRQKRKLLAVEPSSVNPSIILKPMEIKTFLGHLVPAAARRQHQTRKEVPPKSDKKRPIHFAPLSDSEDHTEKKGIAGGEIVSLLLVSVAGTGLMVIAYNLIKARSRMWQAESKKNSRLAV